MKEHDLSCPAQGQYKNTPDGVGGEDGDTGARPAAALRLQGERSV